jgi:uncharacterized protein (TIGR00725 family)
VRAPNTVGVIGSGSDPNEPLAAPLGALVARLGSNLVTGGGQGSMAAVCRAFTAAPGRRGACIGVIPCTHDDPTRAPEGYPNAWLDLVLRTHLPERGQRGAEPMSRNHIIVLSADAMVALPGGAGTASELALALEYGRPAIIYCSDAATVVSLPEDVPRVSALSDVERFLIDTLGLASQ